MTLRSRLTLLFLAAVEVTFLSAVAAYWGLQSWRLVTDDLTVIHEQHRRVAAVLERVAANRLRLDTDVYYPLFVQQVLSECRAGAKPIASLRDAEAMMQVMDAAYASARQSGAPQTLRPISR